MAVRHTLLNPKVLRHFFGRNNAVVFVGIEKEFQNFLAEFVQSAIARLGLFCLLLLVQLHFKLRNAFLQMLDLRLFRLNLHLLRLCLIVNKRELTLNRGLAELSGSQVIQERFRHLRKQHARLINQDSSSTSNPIRHSIALIVCIEPWQSVTPTEKHSNKSKRLPESEPVKGEELLESEDLKRQLREAKERLKNEP